VNDESQNRRPPPPAPHDPSNRCLQASPALLEATVAILRANELVESACMWLGTLDENGNGMACAVAVPKQVSAPRNYKVPADAMLEVSATCKARGWTIVGAIHSHPGRGVTHSLYDDLMTPSRRAVSLVVPSYGRWTGPWPTGLGVHEFQGGYWHRLSDADAARRVAMRGDLPCEVLDLR
jgi:hypothetical protein